MKQATKDKRLKALDAKIERLAGIKDKTMNRNRTANAEYDAALQERTLLRNWPVSDSDEAADVDAIDNEAHNGPEDDSKPDHAVENSDANSATGVLGGSGEVLPGADDGSEPVDPSALDAPVEPGDDSGEARESAGRRGGRRAKSE